MSYYNQVINKLTGIRDNTSGVSSKANQSLILNDIATIDGIVDTELINQSVILNDLTHETYIWPDVGHRCRLFSSSNTTQLNNWTQINSTGLNWSSLSWITKTDIGNGTAYITGYQVEHVSCNEKVFLTEFSYGASNSIITRHRTMNRSSFRGVGGTVSQDRVRALPAHANSTLYYRAVCENSSCFIDMSFRYHF